MNFYLPDYFFYNELVNDPQSWEVFFRPLHFIPIPFSVREDNLENNCNWAEGSMPAGSTWGVCVTQASATQQLEPLASALEPKGQGIVQDNNGHLCVFTFKHSALTQASEVMATDYFQTA